MNFDPELNEYSGLNGFLLFFDLETIGMDEATDPTPMVSKSIKSTKPFNPQYLLNFLSEFIKTTIQSTVFVHLLHGILKKKH